MPISTVYSDADNTLWGTDAVYRGAQLRLLEHVESIANLTAQSDDRLTFVRSYDQAIASRHHQHLRYPPGLLAHALILGLRGVAPGEASSHVLHAGDLPEVRDAVTEFVTQLRQPPPLLPGVEEGMRLAAAQGVRLYVVTEGSQDRVAKTLAQYGFLGQVSQVLSVTKTVDLYRRLKKLAIEGVPAMLGDQLDRDIIPAREAGLIAIWIPSAFTPEWADSNQAFRASHVAISFLDAINWLL